MGERERLGVVLDSLQVGLLGVDGSGRVELQNAEASRILGVSARVAFGRPLSELLGQAHPAVELLDEVARTGRAVQKHGCSFARRLGPEPLVADLAAAPVGAGDESDGAVLALWDRTIGLELEQLVDQRAQSEQFAKLAAGIAHEVRNPLGGIRGAAELLLGRLEDERLGRYAALIRDETDRIRRLLDDLSQLTSQRPLDLAPVNVHRVLDALFELQAQSEEWREIDVLREYDPSIPEVEGDADRLAQVLLNLVRNAVEAMRGKGRLIARTRVGGTGHVSQGDRPPGRMVRIDIEDSGPGIAPADLPHIFTPFFGRSERGSGLGLAIARHWTVRHGGRIHASPAPGGGTRVRVELPVRRGA